MDRTRVLSDGTTQTETFYFISSLPPLVRRHATYLCEHWSIENTLHHTLSVTFAEDSSRIRKRNGPEIISVFRRLALSILKADTTVKDNARGKRLIAGWNLDKLKGILLAFQTVWTCDCPVGRLENDGKTNVWYAILKTGSDAKENALPCGIAITPIAVEFRQVHYDHAKLANEMRSEKLPDEFIQTVMTGWWTTCLEILPSRERRAGKF